MIQSWYVSRNSSISYSGLLKIAPNPTCFLISIKSTILLIFLFMILFSHFEGHTFITDALTPEFVLHVCWDLFYPSWVVLFFKVSGLNNLESKLIWGQEGGFWKWYVYEIGLNGLKKSPFVNIKGWCVFVCYVCVPAYSYPCHPFNYHPFN